jgi:hypothetical protein
MKRKWIERIVVVLLVIGFVVGAVASGVSAEPVARTAPTPTPSAGWVCPAGGTCHVFMEWSDKQPTTLFILNAPPGCSSVANGDVGFIVTCD